MSESVFPAGSKWLLYGGMRERLNRLVLKTMRRVSDTGVRIPLPPPGKWISPKVVATFLLSSGFESRSCDGSEAGSTGPLASGNR